MKIYETSRVSSVQFKILSVSLIATVLWLTGAPSFLNYANAAYNLTNVSDTLSSSDLGVASGHTINFTTQQILNDTGGADTIVVTLDPISAAFTINNLAVADFTGSTGLNVVSGCTAGSSEFTLATTATAFILTNCASDSVASTTAISLHIATTSQIVNPSVTGSYIVRIQTFDKGTVPMDMADTRVAILSHVTVTASVDTSFTFTVSGLPSGTAINGVTTSTTTTATAIGFGTLDPSANASTTAGQRLNVTTNAANGFSVTVKENQHLLSSTGADIDNFKDGADTPAPTVWTYPLGTLGNEDTYGHFGVTSSDDENSSEFAGAKFVGNIVAPRTIFTHNGPSDGSTANIGQADVAYKIAITALQEAGTDYTNTLTYVATPTF